MIVTASSSIYLYKYQHIFKCLFMRPWQKLITLDTITSVVHHFTLQVRSTYIYLRLQSIPCSPSTHPTFDKCQIFSSNVS